MYNWNNQKYNIETYYDQLKLRLMLSFKNEKEYFPQRF